MNLLLIEDDDIDSQIFERTLKNLKINCEVLRVKGCDEAFAILNSARPKIILLDMNLPKCNGIDFLKKIKEIENLKTIPVVILTTSDDKEDIDKAYKNHIAGYFTKTFDNQQFEKKISVLLEYWSLCEGN